jgi:hypothetical protein
MPKRPAFTIAGTTVRRGETRDVRLQVSQRYTGDFVTLPVRVIRAAASGPTVFVTATVHGDELNGMGVVHELMFGTPPPLARGVLVLVPVLNIFGFETHDRYMPDRRDLNRSFPGMETGSLSSRLAHLITREIVKPADYGIDLHSAAAPRTNFPNVRGDLRNREVRRMATAFGCELMVNGPGPEKSLRREATKAGCPTIAVEAGEPGKIEPGVLEIGVRGVENVLKELGMLPGEPIRPAYQVRVEKATWVRAEVGGILRFHIAPGEPVEAGQPIATNVSVFGQEQNVLRSPVAGIVLGMTTLPTVKPGEPVCHIAIPNRTLRAIRKTTGKAPRDRLHQRVRADLATSISVSEHEEDWAGDVVTDEG